MLLFNLPGNIIEGVVIIGMHPFVDQIITTLLMRFGNQLFKTVQAGSLHRNGKRGQQDVRSKRQ